MACPWPHHAWEAACQLDACALALQLLIINVEDQDFRDMLFDYRITRAGARCAQQATNLARCLQEVLHRHKTG